MCVHLSVIPSAVYVLLVLSAVQGLKNSGMESANRAEAVGSAWLFKACYCFVLEAGLYGPDYPSRVHGICLCSFDIGWWELGAVGGVLLPVFLFWEGKFAKSPILPVRLLKDRGVWAPFCGSFFISFTYLTAFDYIYPALLVGMNKSKTSASRISMLPTFVFATLTILVGIAVARTKRPRLRHPGGERERV